MRIEGHVGAALTIDGMDGVPFRQGRVGDLVITQFHGKYYEQVSRGNVWYGMSATTGLALLVSATTGGHPTLFNPLGSGVNCSIARLSLTYASGTNAPSGLAWAYTTNAGSSQATAAAILTWTDIAPVNALIGKQGAPRARFSTTNTFTAAPTVLAGIGVGMTTMTNAATNNPFALICDYDGSIILSPGTAISLVCTTTTTTALFNVTLVWEEVPV